MRSLPRALLTGGLGFAVSLAVAACGGSSSLLSSDQASTINQELNQISTALQAGNCQGVSSATVNLSQAVAALPSSVSATLRSNLDQGVSAVGQLANRDCKPAQATSIPTTSTTTSTTPSSTTTTTTTTPTTTTTQTTTTTPTTTTTAPPPATSTSATTPARPGTTSTGSGGAGLGGNGNGNGNGKRGGNGNGGGNGNRSSGGTSAGSGNGG